MFNLQCRINTDMKHWKIHTSHVKAFWDFRCVIFPVVLHDVLEGTIPSIPCRYD
jgi:hypothetical protein